MSERKVLNKYYPPDFDPSKIPKLREPKNKTFSIRIMAPFNMRCNVCGEYIYKGKKFNSRKENVDDEDYLGLRIFRFYIRCPKCVAEIAFKTDLRNTDYTLEAGATRLFEAEKLAQEMAERERKEKEEEELNPMKVLENRTKASHKEMAQIDELEELREINARHAKVDTEVLLDKQRLYEEHLIRLQQEEEDEMIKSMFGEKSGQAIKRLADSDSEEEDGDKPVTKKPTISTGESATDILVEGTAAHSQSSKQPPAKDDLWKRSVGTFSSKSTLAGLVRKKADKNGPSKTGTASEVQKKATEPAKMDNTCSGAPTIKSDGKEQSGDKAENVNGVKAASANGQAKAGASSALGLLGGYSGSESDSNNDSD